MRMLLVVPILHCNAGETADAGIVSGLATVTLPPFVTRYHLSARTHFAQGIKSACEIYVDDRLT
jgi:hypothetical protein